MSNPKMKSENYQNFGGINAKASPYVLTPMEFLDLQNFDFQTPGSLAQRWGSTQYMGQTFAGQITALTEFQKIDGPSYVVAGVSGGLWFGATTGNFQGMSFLGYTAYNIGGGFNTTPNANGGFVFYDMVIGAGTATVKKFMPYNGDITRQFSILGTSIILTGATMGANNLCTAILDNYLFGCDGNKFFKTDGLTMAPVGLPPLTGNADAMFPGVSNAPGSTVIGLGATGFFAFYGSYVNSRGFESQIWPICTVGVGNAASLPGSFLVELDAAIFMPSNYDISSLNIYSFWSGTTLSTGQTGIWSQPYVFNKNVTASGFTKSANGQTIKIVSLGTTTGGMTAITQNWGAEPDTAVNTYFPIGFTLPANGVGIQGANQILALQITPLVPQFCEVYQNCLFLGGFSSALSTAVFSDTGEPEGYPLENQFEVRTNDGDILSGYRAYSTRLHIFKRNSFHVLTGDNPQNFFLQEVSAQYGCLNWRANVIYDDLLLFLDRKGVMLYNGANLQVLSTKVQPYFDRMNYAAAVTTACMVHDKLRNQVITAIPIDGATINNISIVFDYVANAWTTYKGLMPSVMATIQGYNNTKNAFFGSYSGTVNWYGPSFTQDNGAGFTLYLKSRFIHDLGDSVQKQFRRLYINADPIGSTLNMPVNFYQDYGTSQVLQTTFSLGAFQNRIDFGISAKSMAFELANLSTNSPLKIHGFTVEHRLQRRV